MGITKEQKREMALLAGGADIWGYHDAELCRQLERAGLVQIVEASHVPQNWAQQQPYFGAMLTAAGRRALAA